MIYSNFQQKQSMVHMRSKDFEKIESFVSHAFKNNSFPGHSNIVLVFLKRLGIRKRIDTGFYGLKNPEIMHMSSFDV